MDVRYIEDIIVFLINLSGFLLAVWVYSSDKKKKLNQWFALMTFFVTMWVDFAFLANVSTDPFLATVFYRINFTFVSLFLISFYYFYVIYFFNARERYVIWGKYISIIGVFLAYLSLYTDLIVSKAIIQEWGSDIVFGKANLLFNLYSICISLLVVAFSVKKYIHLPRKQKLKLQYFSVGVFFFILFNLIFNVFFSIALHTVEYARFGDYSAMILIAFTAYAITKNNLMGVKTLVAQVLIIVISIILISDILLLSANLTISVLKLIVLVVFLFFSSELFKSVRKEKEARDRLKAANSILEERNKDLRILFEATTEFGKELNSKKISQEVVDDIPRDLKYLGYEIGFISLIDSDSEEIYVYASTNSKKISKVQKDLSFSLSDLKDKYSNKKSPLVKSIKKKKEFITEDFSDFCGGNTDCDKIVEFQKMMKIKSFVSIPLFSGGRVIGVIVFGNSRNKKYIDVRSKRIVKTFSSHIGASIENARLYEKTEAQMKEVAKLNKVLKKKNSDLKTLWNIKTEFLHIASHQLRTPLTSIRGMISMWLDGDFDHLPEEQKNEMLRRISVSTERLNTITNDMLVALEHEGGVADMKFQKISIVEMLKDIMSTLGPGYVEKGLYLKFGKIPKNLPFVEAEPNYLSQVFTNLIDNACKYTEKGGVVVSARKSGKYVEVTVKDTGIGVSPEDKKRIFEKFTRGENAMKINSSGSGLGMFIVKKIIDEHNGKIIFDSPGVGKGSVFKVYLIIKQEDK